MKCKVRILFSLEYKTPLHTTCESDFFHMLNFSSTAMPVVVLATISHYALHDIQKAICPIRSDCSWKRMKDLTTLDQDFYCELPSSTRTSTCSRFSRIQAQISPKIRDAYCFCRVKCVIVLPWISHCRREDNHNHISFSLSDATFQEKEGGEDAIQTSPELGSIVHARTSMDLQPFKIN